MEKPAVKNARTVWFFYLYLSFPRKRGHLLMNDTAKAMIYSSLVFVIQILNFFQIVYVILTFVYTNIDIIFKFIHIIFDT